MSLSVAYNIAKNSLGVNSTLSSIVSRNVAAADSPNASAKSGMVVTDGMGGVRITDVRTAIDSALFERAIVSSASASELGTIKTALDTLKTVIGDTDSGTGPAALISSFRSALQVAAGSPQDVSAARGAIQAAKDLVAALNDSANLVAKTRQDAQNQLGEGVQKLNSLLKEFEQVNSSIILGTAQQQDITDAIDRRNGLVREIAELVDVRPSVRGQNDMVLFLGNGATLFETAAREVVLDGPASIAPGQPGQTLKIDGWPISSADGLGGKLGGLLTVRDEVTVSFGRQLDEIARGLISATAEKDQSATPTEPDLAGLFTYAGGPALPASGTVIDGLASTIRVNANVDPAQGGDLSRLRDGGIAAPGDPAYVYNASGGAGFSDRLVQLMDSLSAKQSFDPASGITGPDVSVVSYANQSASWLETLRSSTSSKLEDKQAVAEHALNAWQGSVGINIDEQMTNMIALQRSFQASSRLLSSVNSMYDALFKAMG